MTKKYNQQGFSLIELMIVVAILGIISSIAMPSYMTYVTKSKRTEAKTELFRIAQLQESHYVQNLSYAKALNSGLDFPSSSQETESGLYSVQTNGLPSSCNGTNANPCTGYTVEATPVAGKSQSKDKRCTNFSLNNTGFKGAQSTTDANSRSATNIKECWS